MAEQFFELSSWPHHRGGCPMLPEQEGQSKSGTAAGLSHESRSPGKPTVMRQIKPGCQSAQSVRIRIKRVIMQLQRHSAGYQGQSLGLNTAPERWGSRPPRCLKAALVKLSRAEAADPCGRRCTHSPDGRKAAPHIS